MSTYLFVDLSNFSAGYQLAMSRVFGEGEYTPQIDMIRNWFEADRVYIYDGVPRNPRHHESAEAFEHRKSTTEARLKNLARLDDVLVRSGSQSRSSKLERQLEQKEVDVLLAVELVTNAFRGTAKHAILFSGDLDFRPAVHAAVEAGTRVTVACFRHQLSADGGLIEAADRWAPLLVPWCASICTNPEIREAVKFHTSLEQWSRPVALDCQNGMKADVFISGRNGVRGELGRLGVYDRRCGNWAARFRIAEKILHWDYDASVPESLRPET